MQQIKNRNNKLHDCRRFIRHGRIKFKVLTARVIEIKKATCYF